MTGKGILAALGAVFAGVVAYKIVQKKKPEVIENLKEKAQKVKEKTVETFQNAGEAFKEGYSQA